MPEFLVSPVYALDRLVPSADYGGSFSDGTEEAYDALRWNDPRTKPPYAAVVANAMLPANPVTPASCTKLGLKRAFGELGLWPKVKAMIASNDDMQEEWDLAIELRASDPIVQRAVTGLAVLGVPLTPDQIAQLMIRANDLVS